ncbi:MAG: uroporphyrinogen decarboxylase family protein [Planctomycetota bacterium]|jgi:uroporphyrinogen decarboxylase
MRYTSFERVKAALAHKEPDRIPFDIGGTMVTGINVNALRDLRKHLGLSGEVQIRDKVTQMADTGDEIIERLKIDIKNVSPEPPSKSGLANDLGLQGEHYRLVDEFGMGWQMPVNGGHYYDLYHSPLKDAQTVKDIEDYPWPDPLDSARYVNLKAKADQIVYNEKKSYVLGRMNSGMWETAMWMTGYEKFYTDMILNKKLVHAIMSKMLEIKMQYWQKALETVGENVLVVSTADDLGGQRGLLVSLELYKEMIWQYHKRLFEFIKKKAKSNVYIFFHNDGAIWETLPLLIEAGVDIMNPWQVNCMGMDDTKKLKKEYGKDLTIWGGSCDTQFVLPFGTPQQVRDETRRRIEDLAPCGGFVFAPIHVIQNGVPPENIMAWWQTLQEYGAYS